MPRDLMPEPSGGIEPVLVASPETRSPAPAAQRDLDDMARDLGPSTSLFWEGNGGGHRGNGGGDAAEDDGGELTMAQKRGLSGRSMFASEGRPRGQGGLHPHVQILSIADLEACVALENAAFPEAERCSREKVCLGVSASLVRSVCEGNVQCSGLL